MYFAQESLWDNFRENTIRESLIHVVMMKMYKVIRIVGLSFNLSKRGENTTVGEEIPGLGAGMCGEESKTPAVFIGYVVHCSEDGSIVYTLPVFVPVFCFLLLFRNSL